ncbi:hypothetical protein DTO271G3_7162 [Paecilomyces variotii]|nr:hypothetical protein DTO271G3_7162 [Paecilomyces variotii]
MPQYRVGQEVRYKPVGGPASHTSESVGVIREVITEPGNLTNRNVEASRQNPRYEEEKKKKGFGSWRIGRQSD